MEVFLPSSSCLVDKAAFFRFSAAAVNVLGVSISHFSRCYSVPVLSWVLYKIQRRAAHVGKLFRFFYLRDAKAFSMMALDGGANWYWNAFLISFEVCFAYCKLDWRWEIKGWKISIVSPSTWFLLCVRPSSIFHLIDTRCRHFSVARHCYSKGVNFFLRPKGWMEFLFV